MIFITPGGLKKITEGLDWIASLSEGKVETVREPQRDEILIGVAAVAVAWSTAWALKTAGERIGPAMGRKFIEFIEEEF